MNLAIREKQITFSAHTDCAANDSKSPMSIRLLQVSHGKAYSAQRVYGHTENESSLGNFCWLHGNFYSLTSVTRLQKIKLPHVTLCLHAPGVCMSVASQSSIETDAPIELVFGCLRPLRYCVGSKFGYIQNKGISFWNLVANSWLRKKTLPSVVSLVRRRWTLSVIYWRPSLVEQSWRYLRRSTSLAVSHWAPTFVYITKHLCTLQGATDP